MLLTDGVGLFEGDPVPDLGLGADGLLPQQSSLVGIQNAELRIKPDEMKMLAEQPGAIRRL